MSAQPFAVAMNRGDVLGYGTPLGETPAGVPVYGWAVQDLTDLEHRTPFANGVAVGEPLAVLCMGQATRERMAAAVT